MRTLEDDERALLERRARALKRRFLVAAAWIPIGALLPFGILMMLPHRFGPAWIEIVVALLLLAVASGLPTMAALRAQSAWNTRRRCLADLEAGEAQVFEGTLEADDVLDEEQKQLMALGLLIPSPGAPQRLDALPESGTALHRLQHGIALVRVTIAEVAAGPGYAMRVEVPPEVAFLEGAPDVRFLRRTLNEHERAELGTHIRRLRKPGSMAALWAAWCVLWVLVAALHPGGAQQSWIERWPFAVLQIAILVGFALAYVRSLRLAAGLARDTRTGWAFTLHRDATPDAEETASFADPARGLEFLPHSRALWNERGRPARWRNLRRAA